MSQIIGALSVIDTEKQRYFLWYEQLTYFLQHFQFLFKIWSNFCSKYDLAENILEKSHYILLIFAILGTKAVIDTERHRYFLLYWNIFCKISNFCRTLYWSGRKLIEKQFIFYWFLLFQILGNKSAIDRERLRYLLWYANIFCNISNCRWRSDLAENIQQKSH